MTSLYTITKLTATESHFSAEITFNPAHPVFSGHFPGKPIVPGVVLVEISTAVASRLKSCELTLIEASVIKFLQVFEPLKHPLVIIEGSIFDEEDGRYRADASFYADDMIFAKLRGIRLQS